MNSTERLLQVFAKQWQAENLNDGQHRLISWANQDLFFGPYQEEGYPGWESALTQIKEALEDLPHQLYLDIQGDYWQEEEPEPMECGNCYAQGTIDCYECYGDGDDCGTCTDGTVECGFCAGTGKEEVSWEDWTLVTHKELVQSVVGRELASYL